MRQDHAFVEYRGLVRQTGTDPRGHGLRSPGILHDLDRATADTPACIADLLLVAKVDRRDKKLAVVANRTRKNTKSFEKLMRFLDSLGIPIIAVLRDSQNFVHAAEEGIGICEMQPYKVKKDIVELEKIVSWLDGWKERRYRTSDTSIIERSPNVTVLRRSGSS
jgi:septum formation inhibitor-activating ATPase MinD